MKNYIFSSFFILFVTVLASAQRYVPLMAENRTLTEDYQGPNDLVHDMAEYNGKLLIVGQFTEINQEPFNSIAYWDGNNYSAFETPLESEIYIRDVLETPLGLVISGDFDSGNILTYTGSSWEELGAGFDGAVLETVWFENKLWAGGKFDYSGGIATQKIAYYENGSWIQAGDGLDDEVRDLIVFQDELYAVGQFNFSGVNAANHIAKWNGTSWIQVAGGLNDDANILAIYEDELLIGGKFNASADGLTPLEKLVTLNGNEFQDLASLPQNTSQIGHLNVIGDNLFMAEGRNTIDGLLDTENGLVFSDNELLDVFYDTGFSKVIEFEGDIICSSFKVDLESNDMDFFRRTALGVFKLTGSLEEDFSLNSIQTKVSCSAGLFRDLETSSAGYFTAPLDEYKSSIYQASPWIGGVSEELFISHHTYTIDNEDPFFRMGPISDSYDQEYVNKYFRVWKTTSQEISSHISNFNQPDYVTPESILYFCGF